MEWIEITIKGIHLIMDGIWSFRIKRQPHTWHKFDIIVPLEVQSTKQSGWSFGWSMDSGFPILPMGKVWSNWTSWGSGMSQSYSSDEIPSPTPEKGWKRMAFPTRINDSLLSCVHNSGNVFGPQTSWATGGIFHAGPLWVARRLTPLWRCLLSREYLNLKSQIRSISPKKPASLNWKTTVDGSLKSGVHQLRER